MCLNCEMKEKTAKNVAKLHTRVGKVWNWSNLVLIKVVDFFIKFDKNFVWNFFFFHTHSFLTKEGTQLAGYLLRSKNHAFEWNFHFKQSVYQILWKNQQLLLIPSCFNFIPYPPYATRLKFVHITKYTFAVFSFF